MKGDRYFVLKADDIETHLSEKRKKELFDIYYEVCVKKFKLGEDEKRYMILEDDDIIADKVKEYINKLRDENEQNITYNS